MQYNCNVSHYIVSILFCVFTLWNYPCNAQISLNEKDRHAKIDEYLTLAKSTLDIKVSMEAAQKAKALSLDFDKEKLIASNLSIASIYQQKSILDSSLLLINIALKDAKTLQNDTLEAVAYHARGMNYQYEGRMELAIESYYNALKINELLGLDSQRVRQLNNIGLIYREEEEYERALEYLEKCLKISREKELKKYEIYAYGNTGYILMKQNKWDAALERFETALELSQYLNDTIFFCTANYLISDVKLHKKDYKAAKNYAQEALNLANHIDFALGKVFSKRVLSDVYRHEGKYDKARKLAKECVDYIEKKSAYLYFEDVLNVWYNIEYETGNYKKALELQNQLYARKDSLIEVKTKEKIANSEYKYQLLKNGQENQLLKVKNEGSRKTSILAIAIALLLSLLAILSHFAYRKSRDYNKTLTKAIEERTKELEHSNRSLAKSNEELERFAFIASHDLKTPLRDIVSFTGLLERQLKSYDNKKVHEYLSFIRKGGMRLNDLVNDTLKYSRLSRLENEYQTTSIDLNDLLNKLQNSMSKYIEEKNAKIIKMDNLPHIKAHYSSVNLLFQNLVENGLKYNHSNTPTIKIYTKENSGSLSIFVEDNGIGIPKEYHDKIFVMFSRLHHHNEYKGSGLGLAICKKIVEQLNGEIHIQSGGNKGSIFEIKLPLT